MPSAPPSPPLTMQTPLSCAAVPRFHVCSASTETKKISIAVAKKLTQRAGTYSVAAGCSLNTSGGLRPTWWDAGGQKQRRHQLILQHVPGLSVVISVANAVLAYALCSCSGWQGYLYLPAQGRQPLVGHVPSNTDRSFAPCVLLQTDVSVQQSSYPNAKAVCSWRSIKMLYLFPEVNL